MASVHRRAGKRGHWEPLWPGMRLPEAMHPKARRAMTPARDSARRRRGQEGGHPWGRPKAAALPREVEQRQEPEAWNPSEMMDP